MSSWTALLCCLHEGPPVVSDHPRLLVPRQVLGGRSEVSRPRLRVAEEFDERIGERTCVIGLHSWTGGASRLRQPPVVGHDGDASTGSGLEGDRAEGFRKFRGRNGHFVTTQGCPQVCAQEPPGEGDVVGHTCALGPFLEEWTLGAVADDRHVGVWVMPDDIDQGVDDEVDALLLVVEPCDADHRTCRRGHVCRMEDLRPVTVVDDLVGTSDAVSGGATVGGEHRGPVDDRQLG